VIEATVHVDNYIVEQVTPLLIDVDVTTYVIIYIAVLNEVIRLNNYIRSGWVGATSPGGGPVTPATLGTPFTPSYQQRTSQVSHGTFYVTGSRVSGIWVGSGCEL